MYIVHCRHVYSVLNDVCSVLYTCIKRKTAFCAEYKILDIVCRKYVVCAYCALGVITAVSNSLEHKISYLLHAHPMHLDFDEL